MEVLLFALALALLLLAGGGVALVLLPRGRRVSALEVASLSILFGAGVISLVQFLCGYFIEGWVLRALVSLIALVLGVAMWRARGRVEIVWRMMWGWRDWLFVGLMLLQLLVIVWASLRLALTYDGLFIWDSKARLIHEAGGMMPIAYFRDWPATFVHPLHPNYPLLFPFIKGWFYGWIGNANQTVGKFIPLLFYFAMIGLLASAGTRLGGSRRRGLLIAVLLSIIPWVILRVAGGEADLPLAAFYLGAVIYLLEYWETGETRLLILSGALGAMMPWVKQDGMILWACLVAVALIGTVRTRQWRAFMLLVLPGALFLGLWKIFLYLVQAEVYQIFYPVTWATLRNNIDRVPWIARLIVQEMMNWRYWSLLWVVPLVGLVQLFDRRSRKLTAAWLALIFFPVALYGSTYIFSRWEPFTQHVELSLGRLLLHVAPIVVLGVALLFRRTPTPLLDAE